MPPFKYTSSFLSIALMPTKFIYSTPPWSSDSGSSCSATPYLRNRTLGLEKRGAKCARHRTLSGARNDLCSDSDDLEDPDNDSSDDGLGDDHQVRYPIIGSLVINEPWY
jgi:hypothetical protein